MWSIISKRQDKNKATKLTAYEAIEISIMCDLGTVDPEQVAAFFCITPSALHHIKSGKNWSEVTHRRERPEWMRRFGWFTRLGLIFDLIKAKKNKEKIREIADKYKIPYSSAARVSRKNILTKEWELVDNGIVADSDIKLPDLKQLYIAMEQ